jgi:hypothetical protein
LNGSKDTKVTFEVSTGVQVLRFSKVDDIPLDIKAISYCQPLTRSFGALDSFVLGFGYKQKETLCFANECQRASW